ncbi:MAG: alpha/beta fold hydrolase, partial [Chloroflexota bacterium]
AGGPWLQPPGRRHPGRGRSGEGMSLELYTEVIGSGPSLLALHGGPGMCHAYLRPGLDGLAGDCRVVYYDARGHGRSPGAAPRRIERLADDAEDLRRRLGLGDVVLLGSSFGGFVSLTYALRHPQHLRGLILVDTAASSAFRDEQQANARRLASPPQREALERLWNNTIDTDEQFAEDWRTILPLYYHDPSKIPTPDRTIYRIATRRALLPSIATYDVRTRLGEIDAPALVCAGQHDWITPPSQAAELAAGLPRARLVLFQHSGHLPFQEEPALFRQVATTFLRGLGPA